VELSPETYTLVITGPNTGGKTVVLKTVGLLALMAQSGLHLPALRGSEISLFDAIFADIGDEQSIEQSLSTFSSHITNIIRILAQADSKSLVILDELGAGTDPQEGAALARALLTHLLGQGITTLVTTHHPELKAFAHATSGVDNASVEFDLLTLRPTYRLTIGLPGRSNAMAIAERLGLPESIIRTARSEIRAEDIRADDLLDEIQQQRELAQQSRSAAEKSRQESEALRSELVEHLEGIEDERLQILEEARLESEAQVQEIKTEVEKVKQELTRLRKPTEYLSTIEERVEELEADIVQPEAAVQPEIFIPLNRQIKSGDRVRLRTLETKGVVLSLGEEGVEVQVGNVRVRTRLRDLELIGGGDLGLESGGESAKTGGTDRPRDRAHTGSTSTRTGDFFTDSPGMEINLRGQRADEALDSLERYLDSAYLVGLPFVRIVHGKGTGKLRQVVREALNGHPHVKSFEAGGDKEGGEGVTIAKLDV
jgi:DNA mismatch repair protein MutS2